MSADSEVEIIPSEAEIISRINELHSEAGKLSKMAKDYAEQAISRAIECGRLLAIQKKATKHGDWANWIDENCNFKKSTAYHYIALHKRISQESSYIENFQHVGSLVSENPKTLRQAYIATGILSEPAKANTPHKDDSTVSYIRHIDFIVSWYKDLTEVKSVNDWSPVERQAVLNDLAPLMEIYKALIAAQKNT